MAPVFRKHRRVLPWMLPAMLLAGCSSPSPEAGATDTRANAPATANAATSSSGSGAQSRDACEMLTQADAEALFGKPAVRSPIRNETTMGDTTVSSCSYETAGSDLKSTQRVGLLLRTSSVEDAKTVFEQPAPAPSKREPIVGLGDAAWYDVGMMGQTVVRKGGAVMYLSHTHGVSMQTSLEDGKALAKKILARF